MDTVKKQNQYYYFYGPQDMWMKYLDYVPENYRAKYAAAGIYGIYIEDKLVYIGKSNYCLRRICEHMMGVDSKDEHKSNKYRVLDEAIKRGLSVRFDILDYESDESIRGYKEGCYIREWAPILNYQIPREDNWHRYYKNPIAITITLDELLEEENININPNQNHKS